MNQLSTYVTKINGTIVCQVTTYKLVKGRSLDTSQGWGFNQHALRHFVRPVVVEESKYVVYGLAEYAEYHLLDDAINAAKKASY